MGEIDPGSVALVGVSAIPLVVMLVQVAKIFGLPSSLAGGAAILFGWAVMGASIAWTTWPQSQPYISLIVGGIVIGLAASGTYSQLDNQAKTKAKDLGQDPASVSALPPPPEKEPTKPPATREAVAVYVPGTKPRPSSQRLSELNGGADFIDEQRPVASRLEPAGLDLEPLGTSHGGK